MSLTPVPQFRHFDASSSPSRRRNEEVTPKIGESLSPNRNKVSQAATAALLLSPKIEVTPKITRDRSQYRTPSRPGDTPKFSTDQMQALEKAKACVQEAESYLKNGRVSDSPKVSYFYLLARDFQQTQKSLNLSREQINYVSLTRNASIPAVTTGSLNEMGPPTNLETFSDSSSSAREHELDFVRARISGFSVLPNNGSPSPERPENVVHRAQQYVDNSDGILFSSNFPERESSF